MKKYYVVNDNHVRIADLRETPKFYINDKSGTKYKKIDGAEYLAIYRTTGDRWHKTRYYVYDMDHPKPQELIQKGERSMFAWKVKKEAEAKISELKTYSEFVEINELLGLGVEL